MSPVSGCAQPLWQPDTRTRRSSPRAVEARAERLARGDAEAAGRRPRARDDVVAGLAAGRARSRRAPPTMSDDARLRHVADHEVLVLRRADVVEAVRAHQRRERAELVRGQVAEADRHRHGDEARLALRERLARRARSRRLADDRRAPLLRRQRRRGVRGARALERLVEARDEAFGAEALDQELDARLRALGAVRVLLVQLDHRFHRREELGLGHERAHDDRLARLVAEAAAGEELEARLAVAARRDDREVVQQALRAIALAAARS